MVLKRLSLVIENWYNYSNFCPDYTIKMNINDTWYKDNFENKEKILIVIKKLTQSRIIPEKLFYNPRDPEAEKKRLS